MLGILWAIKRTLNYAQDIVFKKEGKSKVWLRKLSIKIVKVKIYIVFYLSVNYLGGENQQTKKLTWIHLQKLQSESADFIFTF